MAEEDSSPEDYKQDKSQETTNGADGSPPKHGSDSYSWTASEYIDHQQGAGWYASLGLITVALAAGAYFWLDYFTTGTIVVVGAIVGIFAARRPNQLTYELSDREVKIGDKVYPYRSFKSFSIAKDGAMTSLNLSPIKRFIPPISIFFDPADEAKITAILGDRLPLEQHKADRIESLSRRLRF